MPPPPPQHDETTPTTPTNNINTKTIELCSVDISSDYYIDVAYILHGAAAPTLQQLRTGATLLAKQYPVYSGVIVDCNHIVYDPSGATPITIHDNGALPYTVAEYQRGTLQAEPFKQEGRDGFSYFVSGDEKKHELRYATCCYTKLLDGCFLGVSVHHRAADARGTAQFAQVLAFMTRLGIEIEEKEQQEQQQFPLDNLPPHLQLQFDRTPLNHKMDLSVPEDHDISDFFARKVDTLRPMSIFTGVDLSHPAATLTFHFTPEEAQIVKNAAQTRATRHGWPTYISTRDALVGYLFTLHLAATHLHNMAQNKPEDAAASIGLCVSFDTRKHFGLDNTYAGSAALIAFARGGVFDEWLTGIGGPAIMRRAILARTPEISHKMAGWLHNVAQRQPLHSPKSMVEFSWTHGLIHGGFGDGCSTDWTRMGWEDAFFTPQGEALFKAQIASSAAGGGDEDNNNTPVMIVTPPNVVLPGHIKMITDTTRGAAEGFLLHLYTGWEQYEYLKPGGALYGATKDLEWIGRDLDINTMQ